MKIAILSTSSNYLLQQTCIDMGHEVRLIDPRKAYMSISSNVKGFDKLFYGDSGDKPEMITRQAFDAVIPRIGALAELGANVLTFMVENLGYYCPIFPGSIMTATDKGKTLQRLSTAGVRVPKTIMAHKPAHLQWIIDQLGQSSLIVKTLRGSHGNGVLKVDSKTSANSVMRFIYNQGLSVLIEEFIEAGATDYRVWVVGGKVVNAMKRSATSKDEFKANISQGGTGERVELSPEDAELCVKAAAAIGMDGCCAVDLMKDKNNGSSFIIECNGNGGEAIVTLTNHNHWENLIMHIEEATGKKPAGRKMKRQPGTPETDGVNRAVRDRLIMRDEAEAIYFEREQAYLQEKLARYRQ
jgi:ribosomal protein S6--L-glutamate ligase